MTRKVLRWQWGATLAALNEARITVTVRGPLDLPHGSDSIIVATITREHDGWRVWRPGESYFITGPCGIAKAMRVVRGMFAAIVAKQFAGVDRD